MGRLQACADRAVVACGEVRIGDSVRYRLRRYIVRGFTRAGSPVQYVVLQDVKTGDYITVALTEIEPKSG